MSEAVEIVRASAGSGKTYLLAVEYIAAAIRYPRAFQNILAVTFTNKATAEMKERIVKQLSLLSRGEDSDFMESVLERTGMEELVVKVRCKETLDEILRDYSSFSVLTIDKFFQRIIRSFFKELGLDLNYEVMIEKGAAVEMAVDSVLESSGADEDLKRQVAMIVERMLDDSKRVDVKTELVGMLNAVLNSDQSFGDLSQSELAQVEQDFGSLRQDYQKICKQLLYISNEVCKLLGDNSLSASDFKGGSRSFMHYFYKVSRSGDLLAYTKTLAKAAQNGDEKDFVTAKQSVGAVKSILPQVISLVVRYKDLYDSTLKQRVTFEVLNKNFLFFLLLHNLKSEFHTILAQNSEISINRTTELVRSIASEVEVPFIFERLGSRYTMIFIDEFQDTSINQWDGFLPLINEAASIATQRCVMLIGDIKQAIYRFRGGDWRLIGGIAERELGEKVMGLPTLLDTSWRSERVIVEFNNRVMRGVADRAGEYVEKFVEDGTANFVDVESDFLRGLQSILPSAYSDMEQKVAPKRAGTLKGYVELISEEKEVTLKWVCGVVRDLIGRGYSPASVAVLVRTGSQGAEVAGEMLSCGINFISDEVLKIGASRVVKFIVAILTMAVKGEDSITRASVNYFLGDSFEKELDEDVKELLIGLRSKNSLEALDLVVRHFGLESEESYFLLSLSDLIYNFAQKGGYDLRQFVEAWHSGGLKDKTIVLPKSEGAVRILTIHKSKGLEFDAVILPFASWAIFPSQRTTVYARSGDERYREFDGVPLTYTKSLGDSSYQRQYLDEGVSGAVDNVNLLYVALTRAKSELYIGMESRLKSQNVARLLQGIMEVEYGESCVEGEDGVSRYRIGEPLVVTAEQNDSGNSNPKPSYELSMSRYFSYELPELRYDIPEQEEV